MVIDRFVTGGPLDHAPTLGTIKVPALLLHGAKDQHVLPRSTEIMQELVDAGGGTTQRIILEDIGHAPFIEDPARFNSELKAFVSGL